MNTKEHDNEDFLAKWLNDELPNAEKSVFENSEEGKEYLLIKNVTNQLRIKPYDTEGELTKLKKQIKSQSTKTIPIYPIYKYAVAASLVAIIALSYFLLKPGYTIITTEVGMTKTIELPDHSTVKLNGNSTLKYQAKTFNDNRKLELTGEAYFKVEKGNDFIVTTENGQVAVLGTSFNVKSRSQYLDVFCLTGKVRVSADNFAQVLTPSMALRLNNGVLTNEWTKTITPEPLWTTGIIELEDVPLSEALDALVNTFGIKINSSISATNINYSGAFSTSDIKDALRLVLEAENIVYKYDEETKTLSLLSIE
jgi:transmembrane sensor